VMNLVPDKGKAFAETYRILKQGGHFSISDIVLVGEISAELQRQAALYAGCIAGAQQKEEYLQTIRDAGFVNVAVQKERRIDVPNDVLSKILSLEELREFKKNKVGIFSITVYAEKT
jgi:arsenite methyltransferase